MVYRGSFTEQGAVRQALEHYQDALAKCIAELGSEGWEMVAAATVSEHYHTQYFKRPIEDS
jgi:hypothetical protein